MSDPARKDTIQQKFGTCPSCGLGLFVDLMTETYLSTPYVASNTGLPTVGARVERVGASIAHSCGRSEVARLTADGGDDER